MPAEVLESIQEHISSSILKAVDGFMSANEDEDTMTGHMGACLRTGSHTVNVENSEIGGPWTWSIDYRKFRGRGKDATERYIGADGIIELSVSRSGSPETKSLLFQAKTDWRTDKSLLNQAILLSTWREASIFVNYTENGFEAISIDNVLRSRGVRSDAKEVVALSEALGKYFLKCKIGSTDLSYDAQTRRLRWHTTSNVTVETQFSIPHRLRIKVQAPSHEGTVRSIAKSEIHKHRMNVAKEEMVAPLLTSAVVEPKKQKQVLSSAYHPDKLGNLDQLLKDIANIRMQEQNEVFSEILSNRRRNRNQ